MSIVCFGLCESTNVSLYAKHQWPIQCVEHAHDSVVQQTVLRRSWWGFHNWLDSQMEKYGASKPVMFCRVRFSAKSCNIDASTELKSQNSLSRHDPGKNTQVKHNMRFSGVMKQRYGKSPCLMANHLRHKPCFTAVLDYRIGCIPRYKPLHFEPGDISSHWPRLMRK